VTLKATNTSNYLRYLVCEYNERPFALPPQINIRGLREGLGFLSDLCERADRIVKSKPVHFFYSDLHRVGQILSQSPEAQRVICHILEEFLKDAGMRVEKD
jgi:hypothetical protein